MICPSVGRVKSPMTHWSAQRVGERNKQMQSHSGPAQPFIFIRADKAAGVVKPNPLN